MRKKAQLVFFFYKTASRETVCAYVYKRLCDTDPVVTAWINCRNWYSQ